MVQATTENCPSAQCGGGSGAFTLQSDLQVNFEMWSYTCIFLAEYACLRECFWCSKKSLTCLSSCPSRLKTLNDLNRLAQLGKRCLFRFLCSLGQLEVLLTQGDLKTTLTFAFKPRTSAHPWVILTIPSVYASKLETASTGISSCLGLPEDTAFLS